MADDLIVLDRDELDGVEPGRAQVFDQPRFVGAAEGIGVQPANGRVVGRHALANHHMVWAARPGHSRS